MPFATSAVYSLLVRPTHPPICSIHPSQAAAGAHPPTHPPTHLANQTGLVVGGIILGILLGGGYVSDNKAILVTVIAVRLPPTHPPSSPREEATCLMRKLFSLQSLRYVSHPPTHLLPTNSTTFQPPRSPPLTHPTIESSTSFEPPRPPLPSHPYSTHPPTHLPTTGL